MKFELLILGNDGVIVVAESDSYMQIFETMHEMVKIYVNEFYETIGKTVDLETEEGRDLLDAIYKIHLAMFLIRENLGEIQNV